MYDAIDGLQSAFNDSLVADVAPDDLGCVRYLDLRVAVQVVTPSHLDPKSRALVQELAKRTRPAPPHLAEFHPGLFSKLRGKFKR